MTDIIPDPELEALEREYTAEIRRVHALEPHLDSARVWQRVEQRVREQRGVGERLEGGAQQRGVVLGRQSFRDGDSQGMRTLRRGIRLGKQPLSRWAWATATAVSAALVAIFAGRYPRQESGTSRTYTTAIGQRATLTLDDGTNVMMAPQTTLRLVRFGQHSRKLVLDGDAYFDVTPSSRVPFFVETESNIVRVLGTAFEVRHYRGEHETRVAVATGKVLVSKNARQRGVVIAARQVLAVTDSTRTVKSVEDMETEIGWLGDELVFRGVPMAKVLETLKRWYGYEFRYTDSAMTRQLVTVGLSMRSSTEALATLEQILDVNLTVVNDTVTLAPAHNRSIPNQRAKHYDVWLPSREIGR